MALPRFFKLPDTQKFDYKPVYYNKPVSDIKNNIAANIKGSFKSNLRKPEKSKQSKISNIKLFVTLIFSAIILYYIFSNIKIITNFIEIITGTNT